MRLGKGRSAWMVSTSRHYGPAIMNDLKGVKIVDNVEIMVNRKKCSIFKENRICNCRTPGSEGYNCAERSMMPETARNLTSGSTAVHANRSRCSTPAAMDIQVEAIK